MRRININMSLLEQRKKDIVLIVDDDPMQRLLISETLEGDQYEVYQAENGQEALQLFKQHNPILVILDVYMPILNGFETCEAIRKLENGQYTAILIATSLEDDQSITRAYDVGATDFITKPINWTILKYRIQYTIRGTKNIDSLHSSQQKTQAILSALPDNMICFNRDGFCLDYHQTSADQIDFHLEVGKNLSDLFPSLITNVFKENMEKVFNLKESQTFEYYLSEVNGKKFFETRLVQNGDHILAIIRNITHSKEAEQKLRHLAYFDQLTNLPNSLYIKETIEEHISNLENKKSHFSIIFIDLDRFKKINDTYGHTIGDQILKLVSDRMIACFNKCSFLKYQGKSKVTMFSRFSGDEFVILLNDQDPINTSSKLSQKILESLSFPFKIGSKELYITPSIGIAIYPQDGQDVDTLLKNADSAVNHSKHEGRNIFHFYTNTMNADSKDRLTLETELRKALELKQFQMHYQPQVDAKTQKIIGAESLIRWYHPEKGVISPVHFIPIAEEIGLIEELGLWTLEASCQQMRSWLDQGISLKAMSFNLSAKQFRNKNLVRDIEMVLEKTQLPPHYLELELTESMVMYEEDKAIKTLNDLKNIGLKIAIDDFGTGYSSLSYLKIFPIDFLKIDRAFVINLDKDPVDAKIVNAIITMAHALQLEVIAEGVETNIHFEKLREHGCDLVQGYLFGKPLAPPDFEALYRENQISQQDVG